MAYALESRIRPAWRVRSLPKLGPSHSVVAVCAAMLMLAGCTFGGKVYLSTAFECTIRRGPNALVRVTAPGGFDTTTIYATVRYGEKVALGPLEVAVDSDRPATQFLLLGSSALCFPDEWGGDVPHDADGMIARPTDYEVSITRPNEDVIARGTIEIVPTLPE